MERNYVDDFKNVLRRLYAPSNSARYNSICSGRGNADEERVWSLCQVFWPPFYTPGNAIIDNYVGNNCLDDGTAQKYITEIQELLDKLGWEKE